jgi:hypothetical protein
VLKHAVVTGLAVKFIAGPAHGDDLGVLRRILDSGKQIIKAVGVSYVTVHQA